MIGCSDEARDSPRHRHLTTTCTTRDASPSINHLSTQPQMYHTLAEQYGNVLSWWRGTRMAYYNTLSTILVLIKVLYNINSLTFDLIDLKIYNLCIFIVEKSSFLKSIIFCLMGLLEKTLKLSKTCTEA